MVKSSYYFLFQKHLRNWIGENTIWPILLLFWFFSIDIAFSNLSCNFWLKDNTAWSLLSLFKGFSQKIYIFLFWIFIKQESRTEQFVLFCPFNNLNKFLTNLPISFLQIFSRNLSWGQYGLINIVLSIKFWPFFSFFFYKNANLIWSGSALFSLRRSLVKKQGSNFDFWSKQVFWWKDNTVWPVLSFIITLMIFIKNFLFDFISLY